MNKFVGAASMRQLLIALRVRKLLLFVLALQLFAIAAVIRSWPVSMVSWMRSNIMDWFLGSVWVTVALGLAIWMLSGLGQARRVARLVEKADPKRSRGLVSDLERDQSLLSRHNGILSRVAMKHKQVKRRNNMRSAMFILGNVCLVLLLLWNRSTIDDPLRNDRKLAHNQQDDVERSRGDGTGQRGPSSPQSGATGKSQAEQPSGGGDTEDGTSQTKQPTGGGSAGSGQNEGKGSNQNQNNGSEEGGQAGDPEDANQNNKGGGEESKCSNQNQNGGEGGGSGSSGGGNGKSGQSESSEGRASDGASGRGQGGKASSSSNEQANTVRSRGSADSSGKRQQGKGNAGKTAGQHGGRGRQGGGGAAGGQFHANSGLDGRSPAFGKRSGGPSRGGRSQSNSRPRLKQTRPEATWEGHGDGFNGVGIDAQPREYAGPTTEWNLPPTSSSIELEANSSLRWLPKEVSDRIHKYYLRLENQAD
jgi:hypothetical protein